MTVWRSHSVRTPLGSAVLAGDSERVSVEKAVGREFVWAVDVAMARLAIAFAALDDESIEVRTLITRTTEREGARLGLLDRQLRILRAAVRRPVPAGVRLGRAAERPLPEPAARLRDRCRPGGAVRDAGVSGVVNRIERVEAPDSRHRQRQQTAGPRVGGSAGP